MSPYARRGHVTSTVYDHTSILKLIQQKWNLPALTPGTPPGSLRWTPSTLDGEPAFAQPPYLPAPSLARGSW